MAFRYGRPMHPDSISSWFHDFLKEHKLPHLRFHGLRHTATSLLIAEGIPAKNISAWLGHSDIGTTMNIYGHAFKSVDREAADRLDHIFNGTDKKPVKEGKS
ncbi:MAG: tyrosine-type recombinase/integrase [Bacillota bacterium]